MVGSMVSSTSMVSYSHYKMTNAHSNSSLRQKMHRSEEYLACDECRISISTKGVEVDSSTGDLYFEAVILVSIIAILYIGKKLADKYIK